MKGKIVIIATILISFLKLNAQDVHFEVYTGKMNNKTPITLYLQSLENPCTAERVYQGMYKWKKEGEWEQLKITKNDKGQLVLVEFGFTGVMILEKGDNGFDGLWISPDLKKQLKVKLHKSIINNQELKKYEDSFEIVNYENNDC